jgi:UDP-N-acetyl-D-mannosaminuronic acid dehydrogenase
VITACDSIHAVIGKRNPVILESTVPPGTERDVVIPILERLGLVSDPDFQVVHAPECVLPGRIMDKLVRNDRSLAQ